MTASGWQDEHRAMLDDCRRRFGALDTWEQGFVQSLSQQLSRPLYVPSPKQLEKLAAIWVRVTAEFPAAVANNLDIFGDCP
jgi:hypothetical protein